MPSLRRDYFYLKEVVDRLKITEFDLQYYMSHGYLLGCVFIASEFQRENDKIPNLSKVPVPFSGYAYLHQNSCRELFLCGSMYEKQFYLDFPDSRLIVPDDRPGLLVRRAGLMVSIWDLEFFSERYEFNGAGAKVSKRSSGRPSVKPDVMEEHDRRVRNNEDHKIKAREAMALYEWARVNIEDDTPPTLETIRGWLSESKPEQRPANAA